MYKIILILDKFFLKYEEGGVSLTPPQPKKKKNTLKNPSISRFKVMFFKINCFLLHHLYLLYGLLLNESVFITINSFLLLAMVNIINYFTCGMEDCCLNWQMDSFCKYKWIINTATYDGYCNWMNIATILMNAAMDKRVLQ